MAWLAASPARKSNPLGRLTTLGVSAVEFAPFLLPRKYLDFREGSLVSDFSRLMVGEKQNVMGRLTGEPQVYRDSIPARTVVTLVDAGNNYLTASFFGDPRTVLYRLVDGSRPVCIRGVVDVWNGQLQLRSPVLVSAADVGRVVPVYPGKTGVIAPDTVRERMRDLLPVAIPGAAEWLRERLGCAKDMEADLVARLVGARSAPDFARLLRCAHFPPSPDAGEMACNALRRLATLDVLRQARSIVHRSPDIRASIGLANLHDILREVSLTPTDEQHLAIQEICRDIGKDQPMMRLLSADVGFGKTFVAGAACASVARTGRRVVWLSPNQPLAAQTRDNLAAWWPDLNPGLVVKDSDGVPDSYLLVGTTALLHRLPKDFHPSLLVIDEEQKFGSKQKIDLAGPGTHILKATATCIPRTAAMMEYGGMAVSRLTKPHVQKTIHTRFVGADDRVRLFEAIQGTIQAGHQALVIYPLAESRVREEEVDRKSAEGAFQVWERHFPGRSRFLHGKVSGAEKLAALDDMRTDKADILISTIAVETGIDLPRLRHVVVVHPERLGVNTLHQIRGRVARTGGEGWCDLFLPDPISETSMDRLQILVDYTDGFDVARENMRLQGFGEIAGGDAQSGSSYSFLPGHVLRYDDVDFLCERHPELLAENFGLDPSDCEIVQCRY